MGVLFFPSNRARIFTNVTVHPTQELSAAADTFRGGPEWPHFERQILVRHCRGALPRPVDLRPHPAELEWPYFDSERYLNPQFRPRRRWRPMFGAGDTGPRPPDRWVDAMDTGLWCGAITDHFGHMISNFGMRLAVSSRLAAAPLVFSIYPLPGAEPPAFFWQMIDHLGIDRQRVLLVRKPTRFGRLAVVPQAERPYGGWASRTHLKLMDAITAPSAPAERDDTSVFVSRSRLRHGNFAGEAYLDDMLAATGATVFHPEEVDLHSQLHLYRRARRLIFSEGSALHALQLLGHLDAEIVILPRRPGNIVNNVACVRPLRARARSLRVLPTLRGFVCGLTETGEPQPSRGISVLDEPRLLAGLAAHGIDLARFWDPSTYAARRNADIAAWTERRFNAAAHPGERAAIEKQLHALSVTI